MQIDMPKRRPRGESIIPMINVVFLLLVFFLLTAQLSPPEPFDLTPPDSASDLPSQDRGVLFVSAEGDLAYDEARGDAVWPLIVARDSDEPLEIRADGTTEASRIAALLKHLRDISQTGAQLVVNGG